MGDRCDSLQSRDRGYSSLCLAGGLGSIAEGALLGQGLGAALALLLEAEGQELVVVSGSGLALGVALPLDGRDLPLALEGQGGHQALDLGALGVGLAVGLEGAAVGRHVLAHIVVLGEVEQLADAGGALGAAHAGHLAVGQAGQLLLTCAQPDKQRGLFFSHQ